MDLPPVPYQSPIQSRNGFLSQVWSDFFKKLHVRVGGSAALTNDELYSVGTIRIEDAAVTAAKLAATVAGNGLSGGAGTALSVNVDNTTLEINADALRNKDNGLGFAKFLSTDWTSSKVASGYQKLPNGLYVQWGITASLSSATTTTITLPIAFPTACLQVVPGIRNNTATATTTTGHFGSGNYSTTGFDLYNRTSVALTFNWMAVGY